MEKEKSGERSEKTESKEGLGISGFTLGVLSIVLAGFLGIAISIIGLVFCMIQQKRYKMNLAKIGIILNIIGLIVSVALSMYYLGQVIPLIQQQIAGGVGG